MKKSTVTHDRAARSTRSPRPSQGGSDSRPSPLRSSRRGITFALRVAATLFFAWSTVWAGVAGSSTSNGSGASDVGPVLVLSNAHIGMTAAEIEASQSRPAPQPVPLVSDGPTDLQARADALVAVAAEARQRAVDARARADAAAAAVVAAEQAAMAGTGAAVSGLEASPAVVSLAPTNYVDCVEDSVRRGFPYADSDVACRAHFPETAP